MECSDYRSNNAKYFEIFQKYLCITSLLDSFSMATENDSKRIKYSSKGVMTNNDFLFSLQKFFDVFVIFARDVFFVKEECNK